MLFPLLCALPTLPVKRRYESLTTSLHRPQAPSPKSAPTSHRQSTHPTPPTSSSLAVPSPTNSSASPSGLQTRKRKLSPQPQLRSPGNRVPVRQRRQREDDFAANRPPVVLVPSFRSFPSLLFDHIYIPLLDPLSLTECDVPPGTANRHVHPQQILKRPLAAFKLQARESVQHHYGAT